MSDSTDDGTLYGGSLDRSKLDDMKAGAGDDPYRQAVVADVEAQVAAVDESDAAAEQARDQALDAQAPAEPAADVEATEPEYVEEPESGAPPRAGAGSGRDVWAEYASSKGVEVTDDMTRDEIIAAVEEE